MKSWKQQIEQKEQNDKIKKNIRTLREKETYKNLGTLKADNIKYMEVKGKIKRIPQEYEKTTRNQIT